ncbi:MAG: sigma-70 family RNA polymerase sigma factor [Verrucomicrobiae bacterium]|nr:sigma-70 family RNA polymerase sigma factor [Verrucomicrobiae bacterium]MCP5541177.1 sigma-70 family RNA polymerase sigma factor [Akkermansiaceae bacterium]MCP5550483.1 sigma-70 family RNA polymerase sigma factor [Akkermansiaceae bacterium]
MKTQTQPNPDTEPEPVASSENGRHTLDPANWIQNYRDYLQRFALQRVSDFGAVEDLVQDTFLSAWNARNGFRGDCSERTWLTGVLRNKIVDHYRRNARRPLLLESDLEAGRDTDDSRASTPWIESRPDESDTFQPDRVTDRAEFMRLLDQAVTRLPGTMGHAFRMREMQGRSTDEITRKLKITKGNLWVLIHRAKQHLQRQLGAAWLGLDLGSPPPAAA